MGAELCVMITRQLLSARPWPVGSLVGSLQALELLRHFHSSPSAGTSDLIHYEEIEATQAAGAGAPALTACIIHGLLGAGKNLKTFSQRIVERAGMEGVNLKAVLVDQRNHGR